MDHRISQPALYAGIPGNQLFPGDLYNYFMCHNYASTPYSLHLIFILEKCVIPQKIHIP